MKTPRAAGDPWERGLMVAHWRGRRLLASGGAELQLWHLGPTGTGMPPFGLGIPLALLGLFLTPGRSPSPLLMANPSPDRLAAAAAGARLPGPLRLPAAARRDVHQPADPCRHVRPGRRRVSPRRSPHQRSGLTTGSWADLHPGAWDTAIPLLPAFLARWAQPWIF